MPSKNKELGRILKQRRVLLSLTLRELAARSGISASHLGCMERGERFPSAYILRKIARVLDFDEGELFMLAGFLSRRSPEVAEDSLAFGGERLDPQVASVLAQEPVEVQRTVIGILSILRSLVKSVREK